MKRGILRVFHQTGKARAPLYPDGQNVPKSTLFSEIIQSFWTIFYFHYNAVMPRFKSLLLIIWTRQLSNSKTVLIRYFQCHASKHTCYTNSMTSIQTLYHWNKLYKTIHTSHTFHTVITCAVKRGIKWPNIKYCLNRVECVFVFHTWVCMLATVHTLYYTLNRY